MAKKTIKKNVKLGVVNGENVIGAFSAGGTTSSHTFTVDTTPKVLPITQEFGNGDMNTLRDKINEIIKSL